MSVGRSIVATWEPMEETLVLEATRGLGLELQTTLPKGAVTVPPAGVDEAKPLAHQTWND